MKIKSISAVIIGCLFAGSAMAAAHFSVTPANTNVAEATAAGTQLTFVYHYENQGTDADAIGGDVNWDPTQLTFVSVTGTGCVSQPATPPKTRVRFGTSDPNLDPISTGDKCTFVLEVNADNNGTSWATGDVASLTWSGINMGLAGADVSAEATSTGATVTIVDQGPPTITIDDTDVTLTSPAGAFAGAQSDPATIAVGLIDGGQAGATAGYSCSGTGTQAPFSFAPASQGPFEDGDQGDVQDITVSCTMANAAVTGSVSCTRTGGDTTLVEFDVTCPAAPNPPLAFDPAPPSGTTLNAPGGGTATITVGQEDGNTGESGDVTCTSDNPLITIAPAGTQTINFGDADFDFTVTIPGGEAGTITCTGTDPATAGNNGFTWTYPVSGVYAPPPHLVPATSLWSKLALFGLFGALGMLILGLRRSH